MTSKMLHLHHNTLVLGLLILSKARVASVIFNKYRTYGFSKYDMHDNKPIKAFELWNEAYHFFDLIPPQLDVLS